MADFDYGNARLRAMKSRLLTRRELETLIEAGSLQGMIAGLTKTVYRKPVETALTRATGLDSIAEALRVDLVDTLGKIRRFYSDSARQMVLLVMRSYDIHNLKAILRGLSKGVPASEIRATLIPVGELGSDTLLELARLRNPRTAIDLLATLRLPLAQPLLRLRTSHPGIETLEMEVALDRWHYQEARKVLEDGPAANERLAAALVLDADLSNILTALRFAQNPSERNLLRERFGRDEVDCLFVGPGKLPFAQLARVCSQDTVEAAVETLAGTSYEPTLHLAMEDYARSGRLSDFEKHLKHFRLKWMAGQIVKDPLGIGVVLGYTALKTNEISNLRWIAQAIHLGLKPEAIRAEVEFVS